MKRIMAAFAVLVSITACGSNTSAQDAVKSESASVSTSVMDMINVPCSSLIGHAVTGDEPGCDGAVIVSAPCLREDLSAHGTLYRGQDKTGAFIFGKVGGVWQQGTASTTQTQMGKVLGC